MASALTRGGVSPAVARALAEEAVTGIQGALTLARALNDASIFRPTLERLKDRSESSLPSLR